MRTFESGATRDVDDTKLDLEGFLHPTVLERFAEYMHENRVQADGNLRASDNWQKGIPKDAYMKSAFRHFMDVWKEHRGIKTKDGVEKAICALMFNIMGYLFELLREKQVVTDQKEYNKRVEDYLTEAVYITKEPYQTKGWDEFIDTRPLEIGDCDPIHFGHLPCYSDRGEWVHNHSEAVPCPWKHPAPHSEAAGEPNPAFSAVATVVGSEVLGICPQQSATDGDEMAPSQCVSRCY